MDSEPATLRAEETAAHTEPEHGSRPLEVRKGTVVGRYVVLREVGRGAMGSVSAAYDPRLDRRVALKLLLDRSGRADAIARLLREAQSLARLDHPNVVGVYDVGEFEDRVFVAMEFVDGHTLRQWQRDRTRPWRELLPAYQQAARGLAAAHAAGVVHRDFKPENAMITEDGRVKVMDFGLARSGPSSVDASPDEDAPLDTLTRAGTLVGTPAYMSPEQFEQRAIGAASDQFSWCVALHEALVGERPFAGASLAELSAAVVAGRIRDPPRGVAVPRWLLQIVRTGLAARPEDRHASMDALLLAIDRGLLRRRRVLFAVGGVAALGLFLAGTVRPADDADCRRATAEIRGSWHTERATQIESALVGTGHAAAHDSWQRARTEVDAFVEAWTEQYDHVCGAWREALSDELVAARRQCLVLQRDYLEGLLDAFSHPTADTIGFAVSATAGLPAPDDCAQIDALNEAAPARWTDEVMHAERSAARAEARRVAGDHRGAADAYAEALAALGEVPAPRTRARILGARAELLLFAGAVADAEADLVEAQRLAAESGDAELSSELWLDRLAALNIHHSDELDRQEHLVEAVELALTSAGRPPVHVARLSAIRGTIAMDRGRFDDAREHLTAGIAAAEASDAPPTSIASYHDLLGQVLLQRGDYAGARAEMGRALQLVVDAYGPAYPSVFRYHGNLGGACMMAGDWDAAREHFEAVAALLDAADDRVSASRAHNLAQLAGLENAAGNADVAARHAEAAVGVWQQLGLADTPEAATPRLVLHDVALAQGRADEALAHAQAVQRIYEKHRPADHPESVTGLSHVGAALLALGRHADALAAFDRVVAVREAALGPSHESVAIALGKRAKVLEAMGDPAAALASARRAHQIITDANSRTELRAAAAFVYARVLWQAGDDRARALELAGEAIRDYDRSTAAVADDRREVEAWLAARSAQ